MKSKISILWILVLSVFVFSNLAAAEPAIIKDIVVDTQDSSVKISITSNQTLQIETFKNDESPANYIVLDFLGTVYTNLASVIEVNGDPVEKVSLVRGDDEKITLADVEYYALDFLAINLNKAAEYNIKQSKAVIDLNIGSSADIEAAKQEVASSEQKTVELTPPIVVSKVKETPAPTTYRESEPSSSRETELIKREQPVEKKAETTQKNRIRRSRSKTLFSKKEIEAKPKKKIRRSRFRTLFSRKEIKETPEKKEGRRSSGRFLKRKKSRRVKEKKEPAKVSKPERKSETVRASRTKLRPLPAVQSYQSEALIDKIVNETIRDKENVASRIEDLTYELKRMQEELYLSKGQKSKVEQKINEILAKLDQLQNALDEEIRRRQALGGKVDDLMSKREKYIEAKSVYGKLKSRLALISNEALNMNTEFKRMKLRLDELQTERKNIEGEVNAIETEHTQVKADYDKAIRLRKSISIKIDKIARELDQLRRELDIQVEEKEKITEQLKDYEETTGYNVLELAKLKQLLEEKDAMLMDLKGRYGELKLELQAVEAEKSKVEYSYNNAKAEFDRIKVDIETILRENSSD